jgi:protein arginine N-methyltransferase 1
LHFPFLVSLLLAVLVVFLPYSGPRDEYTHWKQTVFYLDQELVANKNETISGTIAVQRNPKNPRDLDIKLSTKFEGKEQAAVDQERLYRLR